MTVAADLEAMRAVARALVERLLAREALQRGPQESSFTVAAAEVVRLLRGDVRAGDTHEADRRVTDADAALRARLEEPTGRLARMARLFQLEPLDVVLMAACAGRDLDAALDRMYAFAWNDFTRKRPDLGFLIQLVGADDPALEAAIMNRLDERAPLRALRMIHIEANDASWSARSVRVADRMIAFMRGHDPIDESVIAAVQISSKPMALDDVVLPHAIIDQVERSLTSSGRARILLAGRAGTGRGLLIESLAAAAGASALRISLPELLADPNALSHRLVACLREAALRGAICILDGDALTDTVPPSLARRISEAIASAPVSVVCVLPTRATWLAGELDNLVEIDVPLPSFADRTLLWSRAMAANVGLADEDSIEIIAGRYAFTGGTIAHAARRAARTAELRDPVAPRVTLDDLSDAARLAFTHRLGDVAQRIPAGFCWEDLVLPDDTLAQLREVVAFARERAFLLENWGLGRKLPYGRGVSAILAGPPGTGKTMVAQLLAKELGYDLYRIDLSQVVNKYIGETEKNLARIFTEAENSHAVLFFDEADALFAKRTNVQSSNDRYANLEVNYLLQRMETYDGVTLLATNLEQGLDDAFKRRVRFAVQFELPDADDRERLWRSMFPPQLPLARDIDWRAIAQRFEMAGGYIKKAAVRAALVAATARPRRAVRHADLMEAAQREYREMGRVTHGIG